MRVAAFFDIDGTLVPPPSLEQRLVKYLRWRGQLRAADFAAWLAEFLLRAPFDWLAATHGNKAHLADVPAAAAERFCANLRVELYPDAVERVEWHAAEGHPIFLVSGTLLPLAQAVCRFLSVPATPLGTAPATSDGRWTGEIVGEAVCGPGKARALARLATEHAIDLARSYAYGDSASDRWMLESVGYPIAVNPTPRLARLARRRGWPVLRFGEGESHRGAEPLRKTQREWEGEEWKS